MGESQHVVPRAGDLDRKLRKAHIRASLFGRRPPAIKLERFTLLERVGAGGMGEVYSAYDERLDRKVAIKLVKNSIQASSQAGERLIREARILAKLSHPNVVQVYDTGVVEGQVYIAMEFIHGQTMTRWLQSLDSLSEQERMRAVGEKLVAAGRGLEAAHRAGLAHRDFKSDNILVGKDGRVCVVDFGLARARDGHALARRGDATPVPPNRQQARTQARAPDFEDATAPLTPEDALVGTPAYMAPEVLRREIADQHSDQFSFCVVLYEALHGHRPFVGTTIKELLGAINSGEIPVGALDRAVPLPVRRALRRGLSAVPNHRFTDMGQLLYELENWPHRRRRLWMAMALALAVALGSALAYAYVRTPSGQPAPYDCTRADDQLEAWWRQQSLPELRASVTSTGHAYADVAWPDMEASLVAYVRDLHTMHRTICRDRSEGRDSDTRSDKRSLCLRQREKRLHHAVEMFGRSGQPDKLVEMLARLPPVEECGDDHALAILPTVPTDPRQKARLEQLADRLGHAQSLFALGRQREAYDEAKILVQETWSLGDNPLTARASLLAGWSAHKLENYSDADRHLQAAAQVASAQGLTPIAVEAFARQIYNRPGSITRHARVLLAAYERQALALEENQLARALFLNNLGTVYRGDGDSERARDYFLRARRAIEASEQLSENIELIGVWQNLGLYIDDPEEQRQVQQRVVAATDARLGIWHPLSLGRRAHASHFIADSQVAAPMLARACRGYEEYHPDRRDALARCLHELALLAIDNGAPAKAVAHWQKVAGQTWPVGREPAPVARLASAFVDLYQGNDRRAHDQLVAVLESMEEEPAERWRRRSLADAHYGLGVSAANLGRTDDARRHVQRAREILQAILAENPNHQGYRRRLRRADDALERGAAIPSQPSR